MPTRSPFTTAPPVTRQTDSAATLLQAPIRFSPVRPSSAPADLAVDPSGTTFLVSNSSKNTVDRVNIATGATTLLADFGGNPGGGRPDGITYDNAGHLYVVLGENQIDQINPTTGAIISTLLLPTPPGASTPQADGLTYDAATGFLYVASDDGGVYQVGINSTTGALISQTYTQVLTPEGLATTEFDGIASLGATLYLVNRDVGGVLASLNAATGAVTGSVTERSAFDGGADDIAPATFGSITTSSPEPGTSLLIGAGLLLIGFAGTLRQRARRS